MSRASGTGSRSASAPPWPPRPRRGTIPRRAPALRIPHRRRGSASQPGQGRGRQAAAQARPRPRSGRRGPADLRRVHRRAGLLRHRRRPYPRRHPLPVSARPRPQPAPLRHRLEQVRRLRDSRQPALHRPPGLEQAAQRRSAHRRRRRSARPHHQAARNESAAWIWSEKIVHPPIIDRDIFEQVQVMASGRATTPPGTSHTARSTPTR